MAVSCDSHRAVSFDNALWTTVCTILGVAYPGNVSSVRREQTSSPIVICICTPSAAARNKRKGLSKKNRFQDLDENKQKEGEDTEIYINVHVEVETSHQERDCLLREHFIHRTPTKARIALGCCSGVVKCG